VSRRCPHGCRFGYQGTEEVHLLPGQILTEGRIGMHLEFRARVGQTSHVRLCKCQTDPHGLADCERRMRKAWRLEEQR
jgi:hypothetical protein